MAYPTVSKPYGLKPINLIGGQVFAGSTRNIAITTSTVSYNTAMFYGDVVQIDATNGTIIKTTLDTESTAVPGVIGVFLGCTYTNPVTKQKLFAQYWPGYASGVTDAMAVIADDPDTLFQVVSVGSTVDGDGLTPVAVAQAVLGGNAQLVLNTGNTNTGDSAYGVYVAGTTSTAAAFRIVDFVAESATSSGYVELIVKFNQGFHSYNNATGL
jgi:hypothetical protein